VKVSDHLAQILGIEPRGQRRRTDQIAEHHREPTPLVLGLGTGCRRRPDIGSLATRSQNGVKADILDPAVRVMRSSTASRWAVQR
jgi:hypothetical protein